MVDLASGLSECVLAAARHYFKYGNQHAVTAVQKLLVAAVTPTCSAPYAPESTFVMPVMAVNLSVTTVPSCRVRARPVTATM